MRVVALTPKAKKLLVEKMGNSPSVRVRQRSGGKVLLSSAVGGFCMWVSLTKDPDWLLVLSERG